MSAAKTVSNPSFPQNQTTTSLPPSHSIARHKQRKRADHLIVTHHYPDNANSDNKEALEAVVAELARLLEERFTKGS